MPDNTTPPISFSDAACPTGAATHWKISESWTKFIYPFLFDVQGDGMEVFSRELLLNRQQPGVWIDTSYSESELENMLPYVKQYLELPSNHHRFTLTPQAIHPNTVFQFMGTSDHRPLAFQLSNIVLHTFFNGVALLAIEVRPVPSTNRDTITIEEVELVNSRLASLARGTPFALKQDQSENSILRLCQNEERLTIKDLIHRLLWPLSSSSSMSIQPIVGRFLPVYGALLLRSANPTPIDVLDRRFYEFAEHHLTILRKTFTPNNIHSFSQIQLGDSDHQYMPYHNVIHTQSLDGGFILAYDNGLHHFSQNPAPAMESFRTSYFYMMLIPLHQRLSILRYATVAAKAGLSPERGSELRRLREEIYDFTSRCYFSQASVSAERNHIYELWQEEFQVVRMYNDLKEEVHDIDNYLADLERERDNELRNEALRRDSRNMQLFSFITLIFLPVSLLLYAIPDVPILARWINFTHHPWRSVVISAAMTLFVAVLLTAMFRMVRRRQHVA